MRAVMLGTRQSNLLWRTVRGAWDAFLTGDRVLLVTVVGDVYMDREDVRGIWMRRG